MTQGFQATTEASTAYIEHVLRLCCGMDPDMTEEHRLRHLFKGLSHNLFLAIAP